MKTTVLLLSIGLTLTALGFAQKAKSQKELDILLEIQNTTDPNLQVTAVHKLLVTFKNTEFKEWANQIAMGAYSKLNDFENMLLYGEETLAINPTNIDVLTVLAYAIPTRTRAFDFDKEEKLNKAEDYARRALRLIPAAEKPRPDLLDEDWMKIRNGLLSNTHDALGLVAFMRNDLEAAQNSFEQSIAVSNSPNPTTLYHYARTLHQRGQVDQALENANKSIEYGGVLGGGGRDLAKSLKAQIVKAKAKEMFNFKSSVKKESSTTLQPNENFAPEATDTAGDSNE